MNGSERGIDNTALLLKIASGDDVALGELVKANMGLVRSIAMRFCGRGCEFEDLCQIGSIGMVKAARSFDFSYGTVFSTYAVPLIIGEIRRFLRDDGPIKVSRRTKTKGAEIMRERERFSRSNGREPRISELAKICDIDEEELVFTLGAHGPIRSLSEPLAGGGDDSGGTLSDVLQNGDQQIDTLTDSIALREALTRLNPEQKRIVELRYFRELSQQKTGELLGISQVKVSREEKKIMAILREAL